MVFKLTVASGHYEAATFGALVWEVLKHRTAHWLKGDGWVD